MNTPTTPVSLASLLVGGFMALSAPALSAAEVTASPPAGYFALVADGGADSRLAFPLVRHPAWIGRVSATLTPDRIEVSGVSAPLSGLYDATPAGPAYYALFLTGALRGVFYPVAANTASDFTLSTAGDDLTSHPLGVLAADALSGDVVRIYPAWTVAEIFGADASSLILDPVTAPPGPVYLAGDQVRLPDQATLAVEKRPASIHAYVEGAGWSMYPQTQYADAGDAPVFPGESLIVRRHGADAAVVLLVGHVAPPSGALRLPALAAGEETDLAVGLLRPAVATLIDSGLGSALNPAPAANSEPGDGLLVFEPGERGFSTPPDQVWRWTDTGWREGPLSVANAELQPGQGYVLRLRGPRVTGFWIHPAAPGESTP